MSPPLHHEVLPAIGLLQQLSEEHLSFIACYGKFLRPSNGDVIIEEGSPQDSLFIILSGTLHIISTANGRQVLLAQLAAGDAMGEVNLFDPASASATAVCRTPGLIWRISREELESLIAADEHIGNALLRAILCQMSKRIRAMNEKLAIAMDKSSFHQFWTSQAE